MSKQSRRAAAVLAALGAAAVLAACGGEPGENEAGGGEAGAAAERGERVSGRFAPTPQAPAAYSDVAGTATLTREAGGTRVVISLRGLPPRQRFTAHLHSGACELTDPGGPHFKFSPDGPEAPPNEIHLGFESDARGGGEASAASEREVPLGEAGSVVVHAEGGPRRTAGAAAGDGYALLVHEGERHGGHAQAPGKVACADLEGAEAEAAAEPGPTIVVEGGEPVGGVRELRFDAGEEVRFQVRSDVADDVHVHGYDLLEPVAAGGTAQFAFPAELEGIYEVELEGRGTQIAELRVEP